MKGLSLVPLKDFKENLPTKNRQINAQYDENYIIVYQAYNDKIADYVIKNQSFGGEFKMGRMTWIKPNFLWMMHRSGWAGKKNQERVLAIKIKRGFFEDLLKRAVLTSYRESVYKTQENWKKQLEESEVRVQWDPAYDIYDQKQPYRAIQIGMKDNIAKQYATEEVIKIIDVSNFAQTQIQLIKSKSEIVLKLPEEKIYPTPFELKQYINEE